MSCIILQRRSIILFIVSKVMNELLTFQNIKYDNKIYTFRYYILWYLQYNNSLDPEKLLNGLPSS